MKYNYFAYKLSNSAVKTVCQVLCLASCMERYTVARAYSTVARTHQQLLSSSLNMHVHAYIYAYAFVIARDMHCLWHTYPQAAALLHCMVWACPLCAPGRGG